MKKTGENESKPEKVLYMADKYAEMIDELTDEEREIGDNIKGVTINNPTIEDIIMIPGQSQLENGENGPFACSICIWATDTKEVILTRENLVNLIKTIDTFDHLANGEKHRNNHLKI
jgi:Mg2+ and Co2+ transporter CorA